MDCPSISQFVKLLVEVRKALKERRMEDIRTNNSEVYMRTRRSGTTSIFRSIYKQRQLFFMIAIPMIIYLLFEYVPMLKLRWAFTNFGEVPLSQVSYVGLDNFIKLINSESFMNAFKNTIIISFIKLLFGFPIPIIIALMLNEIHSRLFKKSVQTIIYFPHFLSWVVIGSVWFLILSPQNSVNAQLATWMGEEPTYWFASKDYIRGLFVLTDIWAEAGYSAIVYLAAITAVDPTLYEAATVDGAGKLSQIWNITLSSIRPTIVIMLIFQLGKILNIFDQVLIMASPIVYEKADVVQTYAYRTGISEMRIGYGMAVSIFKASIGFALVLVTNHFAKKVNDEGVF